MRAFVFPAIAALVLTSCGKLKRETVTGVPDPELAKLVDETGEGVVFRSDLPFPADVEVTVTRTADFQGMVRRSSALGDAAEKTAGISTSVAKLELTGAKLAYTLEKSVFQKPATAAVPGGKETEAPVPTPVTEVLLPQFPLSAAEKKPVFFAREKAGWKSGGDFRAVNLASKISGELDALLVENALAPRRLWLAKKRRFKPGDEISVSRSQLQMILGGNVSGVVKMKLEKTDFVGGHPCGIFSVSGNFSRKNQPDFEGGFMDEEFAVDSGKLWLSLLHPLILREELHGVWTFRSGARGGPALQGSGKAAFVTERVWKAR